MYVDKVCASFRVSPILSNECVSLLIESFASPIWHFVEFWMFLGYLRFVCPHMMFGLQYNQFVAQLFIHLLLSLFPVVFSCIHVNIYCVEYRQVVHRKTKHSKTKISQNETSHCAEDVGNIRNYLSHFENCFDIMRYIVSFSIVSWNSESQSAVSNFIA